MAIGTPVDNIQTVISDVAEHQHRLISQVHAHDRIGNRAVGNGRPGFGNDRRIIACSAVFFFLGCLFRSRNVGLGGCRGTCGAVPLNREFKSLAAAKSA